MIGPRLDALTKPANAVEYDAWAWSLYDLGLAAETLPDYEAALGLYARSVEHNFNHVLLRSAAQIRSGYCYEQIGRWREAMDAYRRGLPGSEEWPESRRLGLVRLSRLLLAAEEHSEALPLLEERLRIEKDGGERRGETVIDYARCVAALGRHGKAERELVELAGESHPLALDALFLLAALYRSVGRTREAVGVLQRVAGHPMAEPNARSAALSQIALLG